MPKHVFHLYHGHMPKHVFHLYHGHMPKHVFHLYHGHMPKHVFHLYHVHMPKQVFHSTAQFFFHSLHLSIFQDNVSLYNSLLYLSESENYVHSNVLCFPLSPSNGVTNVRWFPLAICVHRIDFRSKLHTMPLHSTELWLLSSWAGFPQCPSKGAITYLAWIDASSSEFFFWARDAFLTQHNIFL